MEKWKKMNSLPSDVLKKESIGTCRNAIDHIITAHDTGHTSITYASFKWRKIGFDEILIAHFSIETMFVGSIPNF
jgi:hypothetical protein